MDKASPRRRSGLLSWSLAYAMQMAGSKVSRQCLNESNFVLVALKFTKHFLLQLTTDMEAAGLMFSDSVKLQPHAVIGQTTIWIRSRVVNLCLECKIRKELYV